MDQYLVASLFLVAFFGFAALAYVFNEERKSRRIISSGRPDVHSGPDDVETRSRRAF